MIVVVPALTAVTIPVMLIVATPTLLELHVPPTVASLRLVTEPTHRLAVPNIGP